jgi:hypothetical protein
MPKKSKSSDIRPFARKKVCCCGARGNASFITPGHCAKLVYITKAADAAFNLGWLRKE